MPMPVLATVLLPSPVTRKRRPAALSSIGSSPPSSATLFCIEPTQKLPAGSGRPSLKRTRGQFPSGLAKSLRASFRGCQRMIREASATTSVSGRSVRPRAVGGSGKIQVQDGLRFGVEAVDEEAADVDPVERLFAGVPDRSLPRPIPRRCDADRLRHAHCPLIPADISGSPAHQTPCPKGARHSRPHSPKPGQPRGRNSPR